MKYGLEAFGGDDLSITDDSGLLLRDFDHTFWNCV